MVACPYPSIRKYKGMMMKGYFTYNMPTAAESEPQTGKTSQVPSHWIPDELVDDTGSSTYIL